MFEQELICYHTRLGYHESQLGIGLRIKKTPRTGKISEALPMMDYISLKAYMKEGINFSADNQMFTHWMPLYFQKEKTYVNSKEKEVKKDLKTQFLYLAKKSISMIMTSSTKYFDEEMCLEVFPKILVTITVKIVKGSKHCSIKLLRIFSHFHAILLLFL